MTKKRLVLNFSPALVDQPLTYHLVKDFDLMINILRGVVTPNQPGRLVVEITGKKKSIEDGIQYLRSLGVEIQNLAQDIKWHEDKCTQCTACIPICPTKALTVNRATMEVSYDRDRCIACELCIAVCPFKALEIQF
jgi:Pyruvate/2-oxoacid:ferredoxin oxidoreductase delta subunit